MTQKRGTTLALVFAGGAAGTAAREAITLVFPSTGELPAATWVVNVVGSFVLGALLGAIGSGNSGVTRVLRLGVGTGLCGGFTTYSALAVQTADLVGRDLWSVGLFYALGTVVTGALAAWVGLSAGSAARQSRHRGRGAAS